MLNGVSGPGEVTIACPAAGCTSGVPLLEGNLFGVPKTTQTSAQPVCLVTGGVVRIDKSGSGSVAFALGAKVYWDDSGKVAVAAAGEGGNKLVGVAVTAAGNTDTWVDTLLLGGYVA